MKKSVVAEEWRAEWRAEALVEGQRLSIRRVFQKRFGLMPQELISLLEATTDSDLLDRWLDAMVDIPSASEMAERMKS